MSAAITLPFLSRMGTKKVTTESAEDTEDQTAFTESTRIASGEILCILSKKLRGLRVLRGD